MPTFWLFLSLELALSEEKPVGRDIGDKRPENIMEFSVVNRNQIISGGQIIDIKEAGRVAMWRKTKVKLDNICNYASLTSTKVTWIQKLHASKSLVQKTSFFFFTFGLPP